jgi:transposase
VADATEDDLYAAMDWLLARQDAIEQKLAKRHLREGALVLYDLSSSYFEGSCCPLAKRGYSRDGRPGTLQVNYGLLTDARGCPVAVSVFEGNTSDSLTFLPAVQRVRERFGLTQVVMVGDRGMVSQKAIDELRGQAGVDWITALKSVSIRSLVEQGHLQLGLFDQRNLAEITSPDYPGERLVACRNDALAKLRAHKRESLLQATEALLAVIKASVDAGRLTGQDKIGVQVGKIVNRHKVAKHFELSIGDAALTWARRQDAIDAEAALDGLYVIRTSLGEQHMDAPTCVRSYKALSNVERAFRSLKTVDLKVRPIHHRLADRVRAHILLCMLACHVEWHMREAWRELMFADTDQAAKATRDPVAPATGQALGHGRHAGAQTEVAVVHIERGHIGHHVVGGGRAIGHAADRGRETARGVGADGEAGFLPHLHSAHVGLVHAGFELQLGQVLGHGKQSDGLQRGGHRIARIHRAAEHHPVEGRADRGFGEVGFIR